MKSCISTEGLSDKEAVDTRRGSGRVIVGVDYVKEVSRNPQAFAWDPQDDPKPWMEG